MADLSTTYMGLKLTSPLVVGASSLSKDVDRIKAAEEAGAGALVIKSLFEEQIQLERDELEKSLQTGADFFQEAQSYFPNLEHAGPDQHLFWVEKAREAVKMPLIASLNATNAGTWTDWAKKLEGAGVDAIEANVYTLGSDPGRDSGSIEDSLVAIVKDVAGKVKLPVSVKLSPYVTGLAHLIRRLDEAGAAGIVLFNRFSLPDIGIRNEKVVQKLVFSEAGEALLPLRWTGLMHGRIKADLAAGTGVHDADDAIKMILAGAKAVQVVSTLYRNGIDHLQTMNDGISEWMDGKGYKGIEDFRGKLSHGKLSDPHAFERAQYIKLLLGFD